MSASNSATSRDFINHILSPHVDLAVDLLGMVNSLSTGDPTHRFQTAALIVFLAGVDKVLSFAFELMFLAGVVDWKWLTGGQKLEPGLIECNRGLTAKLNKLCSLGLDLTELQWIVDLRNTYVHCSVIYAGYRERLDDGDPPKSVLQAYGPELMYSMHPLVPVGPAEIRRYAAWLAEGLGCYLDGTKWRDAWSLIAQRLAQLPANPEPERLHLVDGSGADISSLIVSLNDQYVGEGLRLLAI